METFLLRLITPTSTFTLTPPPPPPKKKKNKKQRKKEKKTRDIHIRCSRSLNQSGGIPVQHKSKTEKVGYSDLIKYRK